MALAISIIALAISIGGFVFSMWSWFQANRPIIIVYTETVGSGNMATVLNIVIENVGNRPARDVKLHASPEELARVQIADTTSVAAVDVGRVFSNRAVIPILKPACKVTNAFGQISRGATSTWKPEARLRVSASYMGYERPWRYASEIDLLLSGDGGFAGSCWGEPK